MAENLCPQCGAPISKDVTECKYCGEKITIAQPKPQPQPQSQPQSQPQPQIQNIYVQNQVYDSNINPSWPIKNKTTAGLLAIFLGSIGIHKFYLGKTGQGILYLLFFWTYIPAIIAFIEGIIYFSSTDYNFQIKNQVRLQ